MNTFPNRTRRSAFLTLLAILVAVFTGALAHATTITPTDAVTTRVIVREGPSTNTTEVGSLVPGQTAEVLEAVPNWLKVKLADNTVGFVSKRWVADTAGSGVLPTPAPIVTDRAQESEIKFHFINVGQADSTLVETPCGAILIDAGAQDQDHADKLIRYLDAFFARRTDLNRTLKLVGITHNHIDHTLALKKIVQNFRVERYVDNGFTTGSGAPNPNWLRREVAARRQNIALQTVDNDAVPRSGMTNSLIDPLRCQNSDPKIRVLSGRRNDVGTWTQRAFENQNNHSIVWRVDFGETSLLITGDLEAEGIEEVLEKYRGGRLLDTDIYHVGHHGSHNATTAALLNAVTPTEAVISMGLWSFGLGTNNSFTTNAYGHPRLVTVQLLEDSISATRPPKAVKVANRPRNFSDHTVAKAIFATGWDGTVVVTGKLNGALQTTIER